MGLGFAVYLICSFFCELQMLQTDMNSLLGNKTLKATNQRGTILVLVLIVVSTLVIMAAGLAYRTRIDLRLTHSAAQKAKAYYLALGGIERIKALLAGKNLSPSVLAKICHFTSAAKKEDLFQSVAEPPETRQLILNYCLRDEQAYLNINSSDPAIWKRTGLVNQQHIPAILDWIDPDEDSGPRGAESAFYKRIDPPHIAKNKPLTILKELLFIKGIARRIYLGEDLNRNGRLDENEQDGSLQPPDDDGDSELDPGLVDVFTVWGSGKININTSSAQLLAALPGLDEQAAASVISFRSGPDAALGTDDDQGIKNSEDVEKIEGLTDRQIELLRQYCCFESEYFRVFSYAKLIDGSDCLLMATIKYTDKRPKTITLERLR